MSQRGTDPATEKRRLRAREESENDPLGRWLQDLFDGTAEAVVLAIPALLFSILSSDIAASSAAMGATVVLSVGIAAYRNGRLSVGPEWPPMNTAFVLLRVVWYNVAVVAALFVGATSAATPVAPSELVVAGFVGGGVAAVAVLSLSSAAAAIETVRGV
ncbi:hypothetical protein SAMN04488063_1604 [Halopelagius inordinatus]|uniref:DUF8215 domain-containing protein n=1 Tax=Halopelagius inordinatus TaxID=553467 RepID=A0A1I2PK55_9EURY|nr:hypothetical protein [Halopelagius inordinatus]SFG15803.1 hypothetical protein SAMN04488063_1604 [Halopelagius inordinatus]